MKRLFFFIITCLILTSCDDKVVFEKIIPLKGEKWSFDNVIHFDVNISDTINPFNVLIDIRNSGTYEKSNIYLFISTHAPNGSVLKDTFNIPLADDRGKWIGKGIGNLFNLQAYYKKNIKFPYRGIYEFEIQHAMWKEEIEGISDIGLRIEKAR